MKKNLRCPRFDEALIRWFHASLCVWAGGRTNLTTNIMQLVFIVDDACFELFTIYWC